MIISRFEVGESDKLHKSWFFLRCLKNCNPRSQALAFTHNDTHEQTDAIAVSYARATASPRVCIFFTWKKTGRFIILSHGSNRRIGEPTLQVIYY